VRAFRRNDRLSVCVAALSALALPVAALVFLAPSLAHGAFPGKPGLIAYDTSSQSGGGESESDCVSESDAINTMRPDGSHRIRLGLGIDPAFSPDGRLIAYGICDGVQSDLMVMNSDGSDAHQVLATKKVSEEQPSFSADGRRIFFSRDSGGEGYSQIYSVALDGSSLMRLTHGGHEVSDHSPAAAANGRFAVFDREGRVLTMRPSGTNQKRLAVGYDPAISPNSRSVAYASGGQIFIVGSGGGGAHQLTHLKSTREASGTALSPSFSPDGRWVVFALERSVDYGPGFSDAQKLMKVSVATGKLVDLTTTKVGGFHPDWQPRP
jgi:Periplasmic component of the Tol biopolymer transport system